MLQKGMDTMTGIADEKTKNVNTANFGREFSRGKTIAAISTAQAPGGIGIIRISGPKAFEIADRVFFACSGKKISQQKGYTVLWGKTG